MNKVSVIIPSYNRWKYLQRAIISVLNQEYKNLECIVINDCSTEKEYYSPNNYSQDDRLIIINLSENMRKKHNSSSAQGLTRNEGIKIATGKYLAFLDDDDWWEPNKLQEQMNLVINSNLRMCSTNAIIHKGNFQRLFFDNLNIDNFTFDIIQQNNLIINSSVLIEKELVENEGGFRLINYEDYDLWKRIMIKGINCFYINKCLVHYDGNHGDGILYIIK